jgi:hypothetical protein
VQHPERRLRRRGQVHQVTQPAHVLQIQVPWILEIDV